MFDTTYLRKETFFRMKFVKSNLRMNLSDDKLRSLLKLGSSHLKPDFSTILAPKKQFHYFH